MQPGGRADCACWPTSSLCVGAEDSGPPRGCCCVVMMRVQISIAMAPRRCRRCRRCGRRAASPASTKAWHRLSSRSAHAAVVHHCLYIPTSHGLCTHASYCVVPTCMPSRVVLFAGPPPSPSGMYMCVPHALCWLGGSLRSNLLLLLRKAASGTAQLACTGHPFPRV